MTTKLWAAAVLAISLAGTGVAALKLSRTAPCCAEGAACCFEDSPCCEAGASAGDCCAQGAECCFEESPCCETKSAASARPTKFAEVVKSKGTKAAPECCYPGSPCCASDDCCLKK